MTGYFWRKNAHVWQIAHLLRFSANATVILRDWQNHAAGELGVFGIVLFSVVFAADWRKNPHLPEALVALYAFCFFDNILKLLCFSKKACKYAAAFMACKPSLQKHHPRRIKRSLTRRVNIMKARRMKKTPMVLSASCVLCAFAKPFLLAAIREHPQLAKMIILRRGNRLSVTPVSAGEWRILSKPPR